MKKVASPSCPFCPSDSQTIRHLFISCPQASSFWDKFQTWYSTVSKAHILLSEPEVLFGVTRPCTHRLTLNHVIMLGKHFLYINALNNTLFVFSNFISFVQDKMVIEKYIAATLNGERKGSFDRSGNSFSPVKVCPWSNFAASFFFVFFPASNNSIS